METNPYSFKSLVKIYEEYFNLIIHRVKGYKILILDDETKSIISLIFSHSYILENEIFLTLNFNDSNIFDDINSNENNNGNSKFDFKNTKIKYLKHLKAIFLIRPTHNNILKLIKELKKPTFFEYYLFFTNILNDKYIEKIAKADEFEVIKNIVEYYTDVYVLHDYLFTLNINYTSFLYKNDKHILYHNCKKKLMQQKQKQKQTKKYEKLIIDEFQDIEKGTNSIFYNEEDDIDEFMDFVDENGNEEDKNYSKYILFENQTMQRIIDGIFSLLCALRQFPEIIYNHHSSTCKYVIDLLRERVSKHKLLFTNVLEAYASFNDYVNSQKSSNSYNTNYSHDHINLFNNIGVVGTGTGRGTGKGTGGGGGGGSGKGNYGYINNKSSNTITNTSTITGNSVNEDNKNSPSFPNLMNTNTEIPSTNCVFLILDRREDPITPLLTQWTYQAMLHDLIGIENNKINIQTENKESKIVISSLYDEFYSEHLFDNYGDLGIAVKQYVDVYQKETEKKTNLESIDDIQKFLDIFPNYKKLSGSVSKHVNILHKFTQIVDQRQLFHLSEIEQSVSVYHKKGEHFKQVLDTIKNPKYTDYDVLRLALIYALKYEDEEHIKEIKNVLMERKIGKEQVSLMDALLLYSNEQVRKNQLFKEQSFLNFAKSTIKRTLKGTYNVFTIHKSYLYYLVEDIIKAKLNTQIYTSINLGMHSDSSFKTNMNKKPASIIIFFIGGTTYEEYKDMQFLSKKHNIPILLGSTQVHNSQSFLADVLQILKK